MYNDLVIKVYEQRQKREIAEIKTHVIIAPQPHGYFSRTWKLCCLNA